MYTSIKIRKSEQKINKIFMYEQNHTFHFTKTIHWHIKDGSF